MSTSGTTTTGLRRSKRLKRRNIVKAKINHRVIEIDEDDLNALRDMNLHDDEYIGFKVEDKEKRVHQLQFKWMQEDYEIPFDIWKLSSLDSLVFFECRFSKLPSSIGMLQNITSLNFLDSSFDALPDEIGNLIKLEDLYLTDNRMTSLPTSIGNLKNLKRLDLWGVSLSSLPTSIGHLTNLEHLDLYRVPISSFPSSFGNLKRLKYLCISSTKIKKIQKEFRDLSSLYKLEVSGSLLKDVDNQSLRQIIVEDFGKFCFSSVEHLQQLETLYLKNNHYHRRKFSIRRLDGLRQIPNIKRFTVQNPLYDATEDDQKFMLDLVRDTSLGEVDEEFEKRFPGLTYALACNRFKLQSPFSSSNEDSLPFLNKLWPRMLANAGRAFEPWSVEGEENAWYRFRFLDSGKLKSGSIGSHDAVYKLLSDGRKSFVQMLLARGKSLKRRNIIKAKIGSEITTIDEDDYHVLRETLLDPFIERCDIKYDARRVYDLFAVGFERTDDYELPEDFGRLSALNRLKLVGFGLTYIPSSIGMLQNLAFLSLSYNLIYSPLPDEIWNLRNLTTLDLRSNGITYLSDSIENLRNLTHLDLCENPLSSLPNTIGDLINLEWLEVGDTPISSFPASIGNLENLDILGIARTPELKQLPKEFFNLSALRNVTISDTSLLQEFGKLKGLRFLSIDDCAASFDPSSIEHLEQLDSLRLSGLSRGFDVRQLGLLRKLPNLDSLLFVNDSKLEDDEESIGDELLSGDLTQDDRQFILDLVQDTSLIELDPEVELAIPETKFALACNCFQEYNAPFSGTRWNKKIFPFLNKLWPRMLANADYAFSPPFEIPVDWVRIEPHDAIYKLLSEGRDSFVQMLLARKSDKEK